MIHTTTLPSSSAKPLCEHLLPEHYNQLSFSGFYEEEDLFSKISKRLTSLETSKDKNQTELETIISLLQQIQVSQNKMDEFFTRIDWLQRLYKAEDELSSVDTKEKLKQLRQLIAPVQTCPLKSQLLVELDSRESSMPVEAILKEPTRSELLMEKAINDAGDEFINLGKAGREYVIAEVLKIEGDHANTAHVKTLAGQLEQRVLSLLVVTDRAEVIGKLDQLPLSKYTNLEANRKERIADLLIEKKGWTGLFSLDRKIAQLNTALDQEERENYERENVINLPEGKATTTIDLRFTSID